MILTINELSGAVVARTAARRAPSGEKARSRMRSDGIGVWWRVNLGGRRQEGNRGPQRLISFKRRVEPSGFDREQRGLASSIRIVGQDSCRVGG